MLRRIKPLSLALLPFKQSLRLLVTKSPHRYNHKNYSDNDNDNPYERKQKTKNVGAECSIYLHKSRGQHILTNPRVLDAIVRKAELRPTDTVLEIGPGTGNLTLKLLEVAQKVVAIEIDPRMIQILNTRLSEHGLQDRVTVICKDALKAEFPHFDIIVANIPYGISSPLIAKIVFGTNTFRSCTLLLQKEFARRLLANPGDSEYNRLAVNVKLVADVKFVMDVSKRDFVPCPKVDSSVVKIHRKGEVPGVDINEWWAFTRTCFSKKNKTLGATFKQKRKVVELFKRSQMIDVFEENGVEQYSFDDRDEEDEKDDEGECSLVCLEMAMSLFKDKIVGVLKAGEFEDKRPSKLSNEELLRLLTLFNQAGIHFHHQAKRKDEFVVTYATT
ncbi:hypothetical protein IFM89_005787 [Coptis chinensis]|uniref:rRNA adenine N(6)-methyltransferase n=1 Tax=Coptis chinensis TaxID=261450 RepID=A0A835IMD7_9MAGN|nr:hypothetical protein IFM89_005787 [Coptis chinensis]